MTEEEVNEEAVKFMLEELRRPRGSDRPDGQTAGVANTESSDSGPSVTGKDNGKAAII